MSIHLRLTSRALAKLLTRATMKTTCMITRANMKTSPLKDTSVSKQALTLILTSAVTFSPSSSESGATLFANN